MGREIRRVPRDWEHPRNEQGYYKPLYDHDYDTAAQKWLKGLAAWESGEDESREKYDVRYYWDWDGSPPDFDYCRPVFTEPATHYQIYETVTEGTPDSPVFETLAEMVGWLIGEGYSKKAAVNFAKQGYAPSMLWTSNGIISGIETCAYYGDANETPSS